MPEARDNHEKTIKKHVLVGIRIDNSSRELLDWALVKIAEPGDSVLAIHVCSSSDYVVKNKALLDEYLETYEGLCSIKKVEVKGKVLAGKSALKILVQEVKNYAAIALVVGLGKQCGFRSPISPARRCAKRLPSGTDVIAIHNGKVVYRRCNHSTQLPGLPLETKPSSIKESQSDGSSEVSSFSDESRDSIEQKRVFLKCNSVMETEIYEQKPPGWPLLRRATSAAPHALQKRNISVVQWVMNLPARDIDLSDGSRFPSSFSKDLAISIKRNPTGCQWFSLAVLRDATSHFSSDNLIGKGGCNNVYKGILEDGKPIAVKILKSSKESWKDFAQEIGIVSSLKHKHIAPLLGICIEDNNFISVYEFSCKGSLEENLQGLSWDARFNIAITIAEALGHLHNLSPNPIIHRDVKSSNILLQEGFEPQLTDFGLAIHGPTTSEFITQVDLVGTFGYLAPEYFMSGKVSDKIDVYAFGVVLLELLSGRKAISNASTTKGQESLVMWAKPLIEIGDVKGLLDPNLDKEINEVELHRMVLAATLCLTRAARLRPGIKEVLRLLRVDQDIEKWTNLKNEDEEDQECKDDEVYLNEIAALHLNVALLDLDDDYTSLSSSEPSNSTRCSSEESLSSNFD